MRRATLLLPLLVVSGVVSSPSVSATTSSLVSVRAEVATAVTASMPVVRLTLASPLNVSALPPLSVTPALATRWVQVAPNQVEALPIGAVSSTSGYAVHVPTAFRCTTTCVAVTPKVATTAFSYSTRWVEQLLAELDYLPVTFTPTKTTNDPVPQVSGTFTWAYPELPASLRSLWYSGNIAVFLQGAIMNFQLTNNLNPTGVVNAATWNTLVHDVATNRSNPTTWNYVDVTQKLPETLTLYVNGVATFHTLVNTGIPQAPSTVGTYPVYLRYTSQTMRGTNPDGSTYNDAGIPWVSYFHGGEALHGFLRNSYGSPQSLGCVEMTYAAAHAVWPHTPLGTLVTVR